MADTEEGMDFLGAFREKFAAPAKVVARLKAERQAGLTPKQRSRKGPPKKQRNFRATARTDALIAALVAGLKLNKTEVMALAVETLAAAKGIGGDQ